jgi:hypothetical protein
MRRPFAAIGTLTGLAILLPIAGSAQTAQSPYRPGLGDLMTMTVQPRHIKLAFAGREKNWTYAAYELHELEEAFERAALAWPQWRSVPVAQMIDSVTKEPMAGVSQAIKSADIDRFNTAYKQLTEACNACHQAADRAMIVIKVPELSSFPDQDFQPVRP